MVLVRQVNREAREVPDDVLHEVVQFLNLTDVGNCVMVCKQWCTAFSCDRVWVSLAKRYFTQLPILRLSAYDIALRSPPRQCVGSGEARSNYIHQRHELHVHDKELEKRKHVETHRPIILHAILGMAWFASVAFLGLLILNLEGFAVSTITQTFSVLHTAYAAIVISILFNVISSAHYEPQPLMERIKRHSQLISLTGVSLSIVLVFFFITIVFETNAMQEPADRWPWTYCFSPILLMLGFWQVLAVLAVRPAVLKWFYNPTVPTLIQLHVVMTTLFPVGLGLSIAALGLFIDTLDVRYLVAASVPFMFATMSVTGTFIMDFCACGKFGDAAAAVSMANLSVLPLGFILYEPRGLLLTPILGFLGSFGVSYVHEWMKRGIAKPAAPAAASTRSVPRPRPRRPVREAARVW